MNFILLGGSETDLNCGPVVITSGRLVAAAGLLA
jgi:hypothetical protein